MLTKVVLQQKSRHCEFETWQPRTSEGDAWKGKRKIKDRWDEETWEVSCQITADMPSYEVTNQCSHKSSIETGFFSSHQRLAFPYVWVPIIHGTGVPVPPLARLPP